MTEQQRFPRAVRDSMARSGAMATCVPVSLDGGGFEAAFFLQVAGPESKEDRRIMRRSQGPFAMGLETDVVTTDHGAVVVIRPELHTRAEDPLVMEILLTPGDGGAHHEALSLLSRQPRLTHNSFVRSTADHQIFHGEFSTTGTYCRRHWRHVHRHRTGTGEYTVYRQDADHSG